MALTLTLAREIAYDAFVAVMHGRQRPEDVLDKLYAEHEKKIKRLDRNFVKELLYGGLRWHSKLFWILQNTSKRDLEKASGEIQAALVLGTYQIYYMDRVPDRAAVNESVEYIRKKGQASACSFVNGILRQIARRAEYFAKPDKQAQPAQYLALQFAHPQWMVERWLQVFRFDKLEGMLSANNKVPPFTVRINTAKLDVANIGELQQRLLKDERTHSERRPLRTALRLKQAPDLGPGSLFAGGHYTIQDEAAQLIGFLVAPNEGEHIVDVAAGPGGKLSHVYELGQERIELTAIERDDRQMQRAKETMSRLGFEKVSWHHGDFLDWTAKEKVDKILLDAPCSGLGVLRRHPEGKWLKSESIIGEMKTRQREMIHHALKQLKAGGELIYAVCSFEKEETDHHVAAIREELGDKVEVVSPVSRLPDYYKRYVTRDNLLLVYAGNQDEMDGFGAFILKLKEEL